MISNQKLLEDALENEHEIIRLDGKEYIRVKVKWFDLEALNEEDLQHNQLPKETLGEAIKKLQKMLQESEAKKLALENYVRYIHEDFNTQLEKKNNQLEKLKEQKQIAAQKHTELKEKTINLKKEIKLLLARTKDKGVATTNIDKSYEELEIDFQKKLEAKNQQYKESLRKSLDQAKKGMETGFLNKIQKLQQEIEEKQNYFVKYLGQLSTAFKLELSTLELNLNKEKATTTLIDQAVNNHITENGFDDISEPLYDEINNLNNKIKKYTEEVGLKVKNIRILIDSMSQINLEQSTINISM